MAPEAADPGNRPSSSTPSDDLREWTFLGSLLDTTDPVASELAPADVWECPQIVRLGNRWLLIVSPVGEHLGRVAYLVGDLAATNTGLRFVPVSGGLVDHGHDFYAATLLAAGDRVLMWGWTWEDRHATAVQKAGWAGALTMTRELTLSAAGQLISKPVAETTVLHQAHSKETLTPQSPSLTLPLEPIDIAVDVHATQSSQVRPELARTMTLELDLANGTAHVAKFVYEESRRNWNTRATFPPSGTHRQIRIIIDGSIAEVFVNGGPTFTERLYPTGPPSLVMRGDEGAHCEVVVRRLVSPSASTAPPA